MLAEFSIYPTDETHMSRDVARVVEKLEEAGIDYRLGPMGTSVEGDIDQVLAAVKACHQAVSEGHRRVITHLVLDDQREGGHHLDEMVQAVEQHLGKPARH